MEGAELGGEIGRTATDFSPQSHRGHRGWIHLRRRSSRRPLKCNRALGPGLLESTYQACLYHELTERGFHVVRQKKLPVVYKGVVIDCGYRIDMVVDNRVLLELKAVERIDPIHEAQTLTYLKLSRLKVGLLMNFNSVLLKDGIRRLVNG